MLNAKQTQLILEEHFKACYNYWKMSGYCKDEREAFANAIGDVRNAKCDPFTPCGEEINIETRDMFVKYREQDLGGNK